MSVDLRTEYLGLKLKNPLVVSACPLTEKIDNLRRIEDAGAAAAVLPSLFEEQLRIEEVQTSEVQDFGTETFAESLSYFPPQEDYHLGPGSYLHCIEEAKKAVSIPIIASLNGASEGGWVRYAKQMQSAGADALELNIYFVAADPEITADQVEARYVSIVASVKQSVSIPLAVKIGPYFCSVGNMARKLVEAGADGLVLFNRLVHVDIDIETMETSPVFSLSTPAELLVPLRWIAILHKRVSASLAATSGIHSARGLLKALAAGADVGMVASVVYKRGIDVLGTILSDMRRWLEEKEYVSVEQIKGSMSQQNCPDPTAFQRGNYMKALKSITSTPI